MIRTARWGLLTALCAAAQPPEPAPPEVVFRTETNLAMVKFHIVQKGQYADGVVPEDIQLLEDGRPRKIALFEGPGQAKRTVPVEVILLFDVSLSVMYENLLDSYAIRDTVLAGLDGTVGVSVYAFGQKFQKFTGPTNRIETLKEALAAAFAFTNLGTPLYESIQKAAKDAWETGGPNVARAMVIFSDGEATTKQKPANAVKAANQYGVTLYPVVLGHERARRQAMEGGPGMGGGGFPGPGAQNRVPQIPQQSPRMDRLRDKEAQMEEFASIAEPTGGRSFDPPFINNTMIKAILAAVVGGVRCEYVAGFYPPSEGEKKPHKLEVKLVNKSKGKLSGGLATVVH
jgi:VWFA-related protein